MKILVVEDDLNSRIFLEKALRSQDYTVEVAANGITALEKALSSPPDMIISDILMPGMDGFDLCRKVKGNSQLQDIPLIFYTATFVDKKDEELALSLGASRFIIKPMNLGELFRIIADLIEEHKEKKLPLPGNHLVEEEKIGEMYSEALERKLEKKVAQLQDELTRLKQSEDELHKMNEEFKIRIKDSTSELANANAGITSFNSLYLERKLRIKELETKIIDLEKILAGGMHEQAVRGEGTQNCRAQKGDRGT